MPTITVTDHQGTRTIEISESALISAGFGIRERIQGHLKEDGQPYNRFKAERVLELNEIVGTFVPTLKSKES